MIKQKAPEHLRANTIQIVSENNFNTAAGMASSASGLSCLAYALFRVYGIEATREQISTYARLGSGSACRSLEGGFVHWYRQIDYGGVPESLALRVRFDNEQWWLDNLRLLICVVKPDPAQSKVKETPSTDGMQLSMQTSELLKLRLENNLPLKHIDQLKRALSEMDFHTFAEVTMRESNQLHAVCLDTLPAIFYMNSASKLIVNTVRDLNEEAG